MNRAIAYSILAILMACLIGYAVVPVAKHLSTTFNSIARVLCPTPRSGHAE